MNWKRNDFEWREKEGTMEQWSGGAREKEKEGTKMKSTIETWNQTLKKENESNEGHILRTMNTNSNL